MENIECSYKGAVQEEDAVHEKIAVLGHCRLRIWSETPKNASPFSNKYSFWFEAWETGEESL